VQDEKMQKLAKRILLGAPVRPHSTKRPITRWCDYISDLT